MPTEAHQAMVVMLKMGTNRIGILTKSLVLVAIQGTLCMVRRLPLVYLTQAGILQSLNADVSKTRTNALDSDTSK